MFQKFVECSILFQNLKESTKMFHNDIARIFQNILGYFTKLENALDCSLLGLPEGSKVFKNLPGWNVTESTRRFEFSRILLKNYRIFQKNPKCSRSFRRFESLLESSNRFENISSSSRKFSNPSNGSNTFQNVPERTSILRKTRKRT